ncbi:transposase, partial [Salipiger aestuarii]|uniref:transposase n=1 Tax=Salipiger aestuarii TaxID=568098 RepID=UPI0020117296
MSSALELCRQDQGGRESLGGHRQVSATARRHGICRSLLTVWRRQYRNGEFATQSGPAFVPVKMAPDL